MCAALNALYKTEPSLYELQFDQKGFEWIDLNNRNESVIVYMRKGKKSADNILVVFNMTPVARENWKISVKGKSKWDIIFCSDDTRFWGSGQSEQHNIETKLVDKKSKSYEINLYLPALGAIVLK